MRTARSVQLILTSSGFCHCQGPPVIIVTFNMEMIHCSLIVFSQIHINNSASNYIVYSSSWSLGDRSPHRWWRIWRGNWLFDDFNLYEDIKVINDWKVWRETEEIKKDKNQRVSIRESLQIFIICLDMWATSISNSSI